MNEEALIKAIETIKTSSDKRVIYKLLVKIRTEVIVNDSGIELFAKLNGILPLIKFLKKPYEQILEVVLSILGNCCTKPESAHKVCEAGTIFPLLKILVNIPNPKIKKTCCRLLGNLSNTQKVCSLLVSKKIANIIQTIFDESKDTAVLLMTVRLVKKLWIEEKFRSQCTLLDIIKKIMDILDKDSVVKKSGKLVFTSGPHIVGDEGFLIDPKSKIQYNSEPKVENRLVPGTTWTDKMICYDAFTVPESKELYELAHEILKCLLVITTNIKDNVKNDVMVKYAASFKYECLIYYANFDSPFRTIALKIVTNLLFTIPTMRVMLMRADSDIMCIISKLVEEINSLTQEEIAMSLRIMCALTGDSCNRNRIRFCGTLKILMDRMNTTQCEKEIEMIINTLYQFRYDNESVVLLLDAGLFEIILKKLFEATKDRSVHKRLEIVTVHKKDKKRKSKDDCNVRSPKVQIMNYDQPSSSPSCSSSHSGESSGRSFRYCRASSLDSDVSYSPVCSDFDDDMDGDDLIVRVWNTPQVNDDNTDDDFEITITNRTTTDQNKMVNNLMNIEGGLIEPIVSILETVTMRSKFEIDMTIPDSLTLLLNVMTMFERPKDKFANIFKKIVINALHFRSILNQNFVFKLRQMISSPPIHEGCVTCKEIKEIVVSLNDHINNTAESGYARGLIAHLILSGDKDIRKRVAIISSYIIRSVDILKMLFNTCKSLDIIMETILTEGDPLAADAALGLTTLAISLEITSEDCVDFSYGKRDEIFMFDKVFDRNVSDLRNPDWGSEMVKFRLNETESIDFSKKMVSKASDVFNSMFSSDFIESRNAEMKLEGISFNGLNYFLYCIMCFHNLPNIKEKPVNMLAALEAYELSNKYLMLTMENVLEEIIRIITDDSNVIDMFEWGIENNKQNIVDTAIEYCLTSNISGERKVDLFRRGNQSIYAEDWNELITSTIINKCMSFRHGSALKGWNGPD